VRDPIPFLGAFESTYQPAHDRDVLETTGHTEHWREDLDLLRACGVRQLRYPVRWHRIEPERDRFDWATTDEVLGHLHDEGFEPVVDLLHHTSHPRWLGHLGHPDFRDRFLRFVEAVAERYPWLPGHTVCNEPFTTFLLCGQEGIWPPHWTGLEGFARLATNVFPALTEASRILADALPAAQHVHVEACERHTAEPGGEPLAELANDRRFLLTDLWLGRKVDDDRPFVRELLAAGGEALLEVEPGVIDVLGLDYYAHNQWHWREDGTGTNVSPQPPPLSELIVEYAERYRVPCLLGETNLSGAASDRATWLKYTLEQCEVARDRGVDVVGYCWFPFIDSADWESQLTQCVGHIDPVGVVWLDDDLQRRTSSMTASYTAAAGGTPAADLPAYRLRAPAADWLAGWLPQMAHWQWQEPPPDEVCSSRRSAGDVVGLAAT
jgi:beta-glucosidase/6-phospho-beta-glucosidase/beta-galactosidase